MQVQLGITIMKMCLFCFILAFFLLLFMKIVHIDEFIALDSFIHVNILFL